MWKSIAENFKSIFTSPPNEIDIVSVGTKRKRDWDADPDVQIVKVEKKRKTDSGENQSVVNFLKLSASKMADWVMRKEKGSLNDTPVGASSNSQCVKIGTSNRNGNSSKVAYVNGDKQQKNHKGQVRHYHHPGVAPPRGNISSRLKNFQTKANDTQDTSLLFSKQRRVSTASQCIRLHEREQYERLIHMQLQSHRAPWQTRIPDPSSLPLSSNRSSLRPSDSDVVSVSSRSSSGDVSIFGTSSFPIQHIPRYKTMPNRTGHSVLDKSSGTQSSSKQYVPDANMTALLDAQRRRAWIDHSQRISKPVTQDRISIATGPTPRRSLARSPQQAGNQAGQESHKLGATIVIDDDDDDIVETSTAASSVADSKDKSKQETKEIPRTDFRKSLFAQESYLENFHKSRKMEQEQRLRQIEEERLKSLAYEEKRKAQEISLERQLKYRMRIFEEEPEVTEEVFVEEEEEEEEALPELTDEMEEIVNRALRAGNSGEVLSDAFRLQITRRDIATLAGLNWLNDEIINFYMNMLMERGEQEGRSKVYAFNTFFYPKIMSGGHSAVKRWTKKVDIFAMHFILIPVHLGMHWCLCIVNMKDKVITYYDSMGGRNNECLHAVRQYVNDESVAKRQTPIDFSEWSLVTAQDIPQQMNGSDCGMFACKYADYVTRGKDITFTQEDMPYFRRRMVYEIITKKTLQ